MQSIFWEPRGLAEKILAEGSRMEYQTYIAMHESVCSRKRVTRGPRSLVLELSSELQVDLTLGVRNEPFRLNPMWRLGVWRNWHLRRQPQPAGGFPTEASLSAQGESPTLTTGRDSSNEASPLTKTALAVSLWSTRTGDGGKKGGGGDGPNREFASVP